MAAQESGPARPVTVALVAHDRMKAALEDWAAAHEADLSICRLIATGTTGARIMQRCPTLVVERMLSGPLGGDQQIGAMIAEGRVDVLVFFVDPLSPQPHDVDVRALMRMAILTDTPAAFNPATANRLLP